jgi:hypothetical protein
MSSNNNSSTEYENEKFKPVETNTQIKITKKEKK